MRDPYLARVEKIHDHFVHGITLDGTAGIARPVLDSWQRCRTARVDPNDGVGKRLVEDEIAARREQNRRLIEVAGPQMRAMYGTVRGSGFVVNLIDTDGYILEMVGDPPIVDNAQVLSFQVGADWSERAVGTNAISLALDNGVSIQVAGAEHFCYSHHTWTCSAAPILGSDGVLLGVLNMSAPAHYRHPHTLGMIISGATAIQGQMALLHQSEEIARARDRLSTILESISEGLMCVNQHGRITRINSWLAHQLGMYKQQLLGQSVDLLGIDRQTVRDMVTHHSVRYRELTLTGKKGSITFYVSGEYLDESEIIDPEIVLAFHGTKNTKRLVHQVMGNRAHYTFGELLTRDEELKQAMALARTVAHVDSTVVLQGESGTGKEIFAHAIHNGGPRKSEPFVAINCAAIPRELMESELFGYEAGAFSGAHKNGNLGKFELADGGTLFLDEIGDMAIDLQVKLLRVIQEKVLYRVGGKTAIPVDVRIIAASNRDLSNAVAEGSFRDDLYYRLNVFMIQIPPLRRRVGDVRLLAEHFLRTFADRYGRKAREINEPAMALLENYGWPGNVRELQNVMERLAMTVVEPIVTPGDLPAFFCREHGFVDVARHTESIRDMEREAIESALQNTGGNVTQAARTLGIGRNTLYRKMKTFGIAAR
jgi:sigma-54 dependent transcriptional regulator, acetoin dehydrogenase operon transcriptional activator AcoR